MRRSKLLFPAIIVAIGTPGSVLRAESQNFHLVDQSVEVDRVHKTATFSLTFDQQPSFVAIDNTQLEAFQYEIDAHKNSLDTPIEFKDIDAIIRGGEIFEGQGLPIRQRDGDGGAHAGGWGPVRALLPFDVQDNTLSFTASLADLGDSDGRFRYRLFTTDNGGLTTDIQAAAIPLPPGAWPGLIVLSALGSIAALQSRPVSGRTGPARPGSE